MHRQVKKRSGLRVGSGPFQSMQYLDQSVSSALLPKLLGTYEKELHAIIESICRLQPFRIIDIGAAEGYYAVGLAQRLPETSVVAYEATESGRTLLKQLAARNGVSNNLEIREGADPEELESALHDKATSVIICDVDGYEKALLDPEAVPDLRHAWLLIEIHDLIEPGTGEALYDRFSSTHEIERIEARARKRDEQPDKDWLCRVLPYSLATYPMKEARPHQYWYWMQPRQRQE